MNSLQINNILKKELGRVFKGVRVLDQIASLKPRAPVEYVFNIWLSTSTVANHYISKQTHDEMEFFKENDSKPVHSRMWRALHCIFISFSSQ